MKSYESPSREDECFVQDFSEHQISIYRISIGYVQRASYNTHTLSLISQNHLA